MKVNLLEIEKSAIFYFIILIGGNPNPEYIIHAYLGNINAWPFHIILVVDTLPCFEQIGSPVVKFAIV